MEVSIEEIGLEPREPLEVRTKYTVGNVVDVEGHDLFLKAVNDPSQDSHREDLANEAAWNIAVAAINANFDWRVPEVINHADDFAWVVFEFIEGNQPGEENLEAQLPIVAGMISDLIALPLGRETAGDLQPWYRGRLSRFQHVVDSDHLDEFDRANFQTVLNSDVSVIKPGVVHGDFNSKNILITEGGQVYLIDAELGTDFDRPEWDKPRYHDAAHYYHLLMCQHHRPDLAGNFFNIIKNTASQQ